MDTRIPFRHPPRPDATLELGQNAMDGIRHSTPARNREQLISQFQRIDGSTRTEAERQIADFERGFSRGIADAADAGSLRGKPEVACKLPLLRHGGVEGSPPGPSVTTTRMIVAARVGMKMRPHAAQYLVRSSARRRLQHTLAQLQALHEALAASRQEAKTTRQQLASLAEANARLQELALRYQQEIATARHFALHDELTGLPNRTLLLDRLSQVLARAKRYDKQFALLFLDLDRFKDVNDTLGHAAGDKLLQRVAERLLSCVRGGDTACRYGGDEFVLLLPEVESENRATEVTEKIRGRLAKPYEIGGHLIALTATVGVAVYPNDGIGQVDLIEHADAAMYRAKGTEGISAMRLKLAASR